ncbi:MAG: aldehyde dehydrogenase family protein, partial [Nitrososphaerota archaeon]|nr:aldehyde dehydrogenase family protein [Nitrososphaerota archaeon]
MSTRTIQTVNPATGEKTASYELYSEARSLGIARKAHETFETKWKRLPIAERQQYLKYLAGALRAKKSEY